MRALVRIIAAIVVAVAATVVPTAGVSAPNTRPALTGSILFAGGPSSATSRDLLAVDAGGGRLRLLVSGSDPGAWSPNGKLLAYMHYVPYGQGPGFYVGVTDRRGRTRKLATMDFPIDIGAAAWSPDGTRLVLPNRMNGQEGIFEVDVRTGKVRQLTHDTYSTQDSGPTQWSPTGNAIMFVRSSAPGSFDLWLVRPDGRHPRQLTFGHNVVTGAAWAPDGRRIVVSESTGYPTLGRVEVLNVATGKTTTLAKAGYFRPAWSPNGHWIALAGSQHGGASGTFLVRPNGGGFHRISSHGDYSGTYGLAWSPSSRALAVIDVSDRMADVWVVAADGSSEQRLTQGWRYGYENIDPQWQPASVAAERLGGTWVAASPPTDSVVRGSTLLTTRAIARLSADGSRVLVRFTPGGCPETWDATAGTVLRFEDCFPEASSPGDIGTQGLAVAGDRFAWSFSEGGLGVDLWQIHVATTEVPNATRVDVAGPVLGPIGSGTQLVYGTWGPCRLSQSPPCATAPKTNGELWRIDGQQPVKIASSAGALTPLAVDDNRILADRENGTLALYGMDGTLERSYSLGASPLAATLGGSDLVVLRPGAVDDLDAASGALRHTWPLTAPDPTLAGVQHGVLAYASGSNMRLLRLADGNEAVIHAGPNLHAQPTPAGLFYSYTTDDTTHPGRVVFMPNGSLP